jgi:O-antigen ligase/predicted negative regulator of RcsB-dependent stress response
VASGRPNAGSAKAPSSKTGGSKSGGGRKGGQRAKVAAQSTPAPAAKATDGMTTSQKVTWFCLQAIVFLVPIAISNANWLPRLMGASMQAFALPLTYDQFDIVKVFVMRAFALIAVGSWAFDFYIRGGRIRRTKADWLILVVLGWVLLTSFTSVHLPTAVFGKYRRFEGLLSFITYAVVYFLTVQLADRPSRIRSLAHTLVVSGTIVSIYGVMQYIGVDPIQWVSPGQNLPFEFNRGFSTFGNPDLLGGYLIFPLAVSLAMALSDKRPAWRLVYWGVTLIVIAAWITAFVRGAWIGGAVSLLIVIVAAVRARVTWETQEWAAAGVTGGVAALVIGRSLQSTNSVLNVWERLKSILQFDQGSARTRFEIWEAAIQAIKERPLFGWGADTFRLVFPHTKPLSYTRDAGYLSVADNVHNYPLQLGSAIGVPGFLLLYGLFGWVLYLGAPNAFARGKGQDRMLVTAFWAASVGYIVHLMFGLSVTGSTVFLWLSMALILAPLATTIDVPARPWGPFVAVLIAAAVTFCSIYNVAYVVADNYYLKAQFGAVSGQTGPLQYMEAALRLNPFNDMYYSQLGKVRQDTMSSWLSQARQLNQQNKDASAAMTNAKAEFLEAEKAYLAAIEFVPLEYDNYVFLTALYNLAGTYFDPAFFDKAVAMADRGIAEERYGPAIRFQKALALYSSGRTDECVTVLQETVLMDPNYADPMGVLADALMKQGKPKEARVQVEALLKLQPDNAQAKALLQAIDGPSAATGTPSPTTAP